MMLRTIVTKTTMSSVLRTIINTSRQVFTKWNREIQVRSAEAQPTAVTMVTTIIGSEKLVCGRSPIVSACLHDVFLGLRRNDMHWEMNIFNPSFPKKI